MGPPILVSEARANQWAPVLTAGPDGQLYIARDPARPGTTTSTCAACVTAGSDIRRITDGPETRPTFPLPASQAGGSGSLTTVGGRLGRFEHAAALHRERQVAIRCLEGEALTAPPPSWRRGRGAVAENGRLFADARGQCGCSSDALSETALGSGGTPLRWAPLVAPAAAARQRRPQRHGGNAGRYGGREQLGGLALTRRRAAASTTRCSRRHCRPASRRRAPLLRGGARSDGSGHHLAGARASGGPLWAGGVHTLPGRSAPAHRAGRLPPVHARTVQQTPTATRSTPPNSTSSP